MPAKEGVTTGHEGRGGREGKIGTSTARTRRQRQGALMGTVLARLLRSTWLADTFARGYTAADIPIRMDLPAFGRFPMPVYAFAVVKLFSSYIVSAGSARVSWQGLWRIALCVALSAFIGCSHPTDDELLRSYKLHSPDFHRLIEMVQSDKGLQRVDEDWTSPQNPETIGVSKDRIMEYRKLLRKIGIPRGFSAFDPTGNIQFPASTQGLAVTGSVKGYVYAVHPPTPVVENLDTYMPPTHGENYTVFRHIEGRWYLYYEHDY